MPGPVTLPPPPPRLDTSLAEGPTVAVTKTAGARIDSYTPSPSTMPELYASIGIVESAPVASATSKWWSAPDKEMDVDIDGYDFDFTPKKNIGKEKVEGEADGPMAHNGWYKVLANKGDHFEIHVNVGTDPDHTNDLNATVTITNGVATVSGTVGGEALPEGLTAHVTGQGTKASPYKVVFHDSSGAAHSIAWRPE